MHFKHYNHDHAQLVWLWICDNLLRRGRHKTKQNKTLVHLIDYRSCGRSSFTWLSGRESPCRHTSPRIKATVLYIIYINQNPSQVSLSLFYQRRRTLLALLYKKQPIYLRCYTVHRRTTIYLVHKGEKIEKRIERERGKKNCPFIVDCQSELLLRLPHTAKEPSRKRKNGDVLLHTINKSPASIRGRNAQSGRKCAQRKDTHIYHEKKNFWRLYSLYMDLFLSSSAFYYTDGEERKK